MAKKSFIPSDEPKSYILSCLSILCGVLVSLFQLLSDFFSTEIQTAISFFWWFFLIPAALLMLYFCIAKAAGKYNEIKSKPWDKQLW